MGYRVVCWTHRVMCWTHPVWFWGQPDENQLNAVKRLLARAGAKEVFFSPY